MEEYSPMTVSEHSALRFDEDMDSIDVDSIPILDKSKLDLSIQYTFTDAARKPKALRMGRKYGSNESFKQIYERLVYLNLGVPFIDTYFEEVFPNKYKNEIRRRSYLLFESIQEEYDRRKRNHRKISDFDVWQDQAVVSGFDDLSFDIKRHIQQCLATGRIPLNFHMSKKTSKIRQSLGLTPLRAFFATGQLIDNLVVSYTAGEREGA